MSEVERLAELKRKLEEEKEKLQQKIEEINLILQLIDSFLRERSFVTAEKLLETESLEEKAEVVEKPEHPEKAPILKREIELFRYQGKVILKAEITPDYARIYIDPEAKIPIESGPIRYLIRLFDKYVDEDLRLIKAGSLDSDKKFTYIIDEEGGYLTRIELLNYASGDRLRNILGKIRWAVKTLLKESEAEGSKEEGTSA